MIAPIPDARRVPSIASAPAATRSSTATSRCWPVRCARRSPSWPAATSRRSSTGPSPTRPRPAAPAPWRPSAGRASAIEGLALDDLTLLVRALGHELHLANLAEQVHRLRRRRRRDDGTPLPESIADAVARLRDGGVAETEILRAARDDVHLELVLTAHPTEAARRTFLQSQLHLAELLNELDAPYLRRRRSDIAGAIAEEATILWLSDDVRSIRPTVDDEIRQGLWFFEKSLFRAAAELAGEWHRNLPGTPPPIAFRTWIGGDQDGNPNAGPDDAARALARSRACSCAHYRARCASCRGRSACRSRWPASRRAGGARSRATRRSCRGCDDDVGVRNADEPYRRKLTAIWRRLDNELAGRTSRSTPTPAGLRRDLDLIDASLRAQPRRPDRRRTAGRAAADGRDLRHAPGAARPAHARRRRARPRRHRPGAGHDRRRTARPRSTG